MADTTEKTVETHYCYDHPSSYGSNDALLASVLNNQNNSMNNPMTAALMANGGMGNQMWNNPMMYLVWMWMMRWMNNGEWGSAASNAESLNYNNRALAQLQSSIDNNHNADLTMEAIHGNGAAIHELASNLNSDYNTISQAICSIKSAIESVAGQVGYSAEKVINAVNMGDSNIISAIQTTSCATQKAILEQGYQSQLATERQTGILGSKIDNNHAASQLQTCQQTNTLQNSIENVRQATVNGFAQIGYQMAADKSEMIQSQTANTQRIMDLLNNHWVAETSQALQDEKFKNSQLQQNQYIASLLNGSCGCNCNS